MKNNLSKIISAKILLLLFGFQVSGQRPAEITRQGNKLYNEKKYNEAEIKYRKTLEAEKNDVTARYNLGNSIYKQEKFENASDYYRQLAEQKDVSKSIRSDAYHNLGNCLLQEKKYEESIEAFKQSLRNNPSDNDTRYNLAYAQSMLRQQQQQQQQNKNKDQKQNQQQQQQQQQQQ
ncbi:MAG: tetratricopeptide repeat protein, partial [Bacteroidota bacterium]